MFSRFKKDRDSSTHRNQTSYTRHSRGWADLLKHLKQSESLRVLDFGATSPPNINYLTSMGHSVYMSNVVEDAAKPEWMVAPAADAAPGTKPEFNVEGFAAGNFDFSGKEFDVVLLWDTANYLPPTAVPALFERLKQVLRPGGRLLAFSHSRTEGPETAFSRYQLTDSEDLLVLSSSDFPIRQIYQTRQIEKFLEGYSSTRFFVGKDNVREVVAVR